MIKHLKGIVMSHDIIFDPAVLGMLMSLLLLHRDLARCCRALNFGICNMIGHDDMVSHTVTVMEPYEDEIEPASHSFSTQKQ